jgi:hypothetical protein
MWVRSLVIPHLETKMDLHGSCATEIRSNGLVRRF